MFWGLVKHFFFFHIKIFFFFFVTLPSNAAFKHVASGELTLWHFVWQGRSLSVLPSINAKEMGQAAECPYSRGHWHIFSSGGRTAAE